MWHQVVFAFARYFVYDEINILVAIQLSVIVFLFSVVSYYFIENPFRNRKIISSKQLYATIIISLLLINSASLYVYVIGGIVKDFPELGLLKSENVGQYNLFSSQNNINIKYNEDVRKLTKPFKFKDKTKVLVVGDSYARDFANILNESKFANYIEISYLDRPSENDINVFKEASIVFYATDVPSYKTKVLQRLKKCEISEKKLWIVGTKDFGNSNGIFFNRDKSAGVCSDYRTFMKKGVFEINQEVKAEWGDRYIDLISYLIDGNRKVLVFTPDCKFISQDTLHLTKFGAIYLAKLLEHRIDNILNSL
jgi:hypothetical protein